MLVETKDYYAILGVDKAATSDEIKKKYRKLAKQYHPDIAGNTKENVDRFKEISEAYEVLGDDEKRKKYDQLMDDIKHGRNPYGAAGGGQWQSYGGAGGFGGSWDDILSQFFGMGGEPQFGGRSRAGGAGFGGGFGGQMSLDVENTITVSLADAFAGGKKTLRLEDGKTVDFNLPAGMLPGEKLKLPGLGRTDGSGRKGNRILQIEIADSDSLSLSGLDVTMKVPLAPWTAAVGGKVDVRPLGSRITVNIPEGSNGGKRLKVPGQGYKDRQGRRGDLILVLELRNPTSLTAEQKALYRRLAEADK